MRTKGFVLVSRNIVQSKQFYENLFSLKVVKDNCGSYELENGLILLDEESFRLYTGRNIDWKNNDAMICFIEENLEAFETKILSLYPNTVFVNRLKRHSREQKVIRFYDLDGHLIEVSES